MLWKFKTRGQVDTQQMYVHESQIQTFYYYLQKFQYYIIRITNNIETKTMNKKRYHCVTRIVIELV